MVAPHADLEKAMTEYQKWLDYAEQSQAVGGQEEMPLALVEELKSISGNHAEIVNRFGQSLSFGTGGLRGTMGVGWNRMNRYTIRKASYALAQHVLREIPDGAKRGIVIGYDCRHQSDVFAVEAALTMVGAGVKAYVFPTLCPTPEVSFAVRELGAAGGVMVTASHNPPIYNGYKVYGPDGGQLLPEAANSVRQLMDDIDDVFSLNIALQSSAEEAGTLAWIQSELHAKYIERVVSNCTSTAVSPEHRGNLRIVYTSLHGTGLVPVCDALQQAGYSRVQTVASQAVYDGDFPTVSSPNPEEPEALSMGIGQAQETLADVVMGTDPDADRVGIAVRTSNGEYQLFSGNQTGAMLVDYVLRCRQSEDALPANGIVLKTIVTSELGALVAKSYGMAVEDTLTGFKYIGERITAYEATEEFTFLMGYEESYGYLMSSIVRDKDAVQTCLTIAEMCAWYKAQGMTLVDGLNALYEKHGWHQEALLTIALQGDKGTEEMTQTLRDLRTTPLKVDGMTLQVVEDYEQGTRIHPIDGTHEKLSLPTSDVLKWIFADGSWAAIRPSGTEPKLKVYVGAVGSTQERCAAVLDLLQKQIASRI